VDHAPRRRARRGSRAVRVPRAAGRGGWAHPARVPPRSKETGAKAGPCDAPDNPALPAFALTPGLNTVTWLESIGHPGAPARFALSLDGSDQGFESCILLDHVPHDEQSRPSFGDETSFHRSSITLYIPDVKCERCHLQLITVMSDDYHGVPTGQSCALPAAQAAGTADASMLECSAVYHSCAPVRINGTVPRAEHTCSRQAHEAQLAWPFMEGMRPRCRMPWHERWGWCSS